MITTATLSQSLHGFFHEWLVNQRNASRHTVWSYRDTWRLFLRFVSSRRGCHVAALKLTDLTADEILVFLKNLEQERHVTIATRNCRLAAIRSFFLYVAERDPLASAQCAEVLRIPIKRGPQRTLCYLEPEELAAILNQPDRTTWLGQRDYALLALLYNTGARIQEALDLCSDAIRIEPPAQVRLFGKGRKERICPLWPETAALLSALLRQHPRPHNEPIFVNRYGHPLGASGVRYRLCQYIKAAGKQVPSLLTKRISPHTFRHTTAVSLVASGVDITIIRSWLGHVQLDTTNRYAQANLETKRKALELIASSSRPTEPPPWKRDADLLTWLDSL